MMRRVTLLTCTALLIGLISPVPSGASDLLRASRASADLARASRASADLAPEGAAAVLVGAGDIAACGSGSRKTAKLLDAIPGTVFTLGDNVYPDGSARNFRRCYEPTWGRHKDRTRPVIGNHDYRSDFGAPYFDYFGTAAGEPFLGYYSYDLGAWHVVVVNSNCDFVDCDDQLHWLEADLKASKAACTVAMWHHPLYTSGSDHGPATWMRPYFQTLYDHGVELNLTGHNHHYERFLPMDATGDVDLDRGVLPIVVGSGGAGHYGFGRIRKHSVTHDDDTYGVLKLTLRTGSYDYEFVPVAGRTYTDGGRGTCH
ncbi:MAG: alkaline phosphatase [Hamadaea sp.]|nr:alkaline phosphatase [Hamadaea sp.]